MLFNFSLGLFVGNMLKTAFKLATVIFLAGPVAVVGAIILQHWYVADQFVALSHSESVSHASQLWFFGSYLGHVLATVAAYTLCLLIVFGVLAFTRRVKKRGGKA